MGKGVGNSTGNDHFNPASNSNQDINTSGQAWYLPTGDEAFRSFGSALAVGQTLSVDVDNGNVSSGNSIGFSLRNGSSNIVWEFYFTGGNTQYSINGANLNGNYPNFTWAGVNVQFTLTTPTNFTATMTRYLDSTVTTVNGSLLSPAGGSGIASIRFFNFSGDDAYYNNLIVGLMDDNAADPAYSAGWASGSNGGQSPLSNGGNIAGANTATITISSTTTSDSAAYDVWVTNSCGAALSTAATLTVNALPTATVSGSATICAGGSTTISAALTGTAPWNVTWSDGTTQTDVATSPASRSISPSSTTNFTVTAVSDANCTGTSSGSATITVNPLPTATVSGTTTICPGGSTSIQAALTGTGPWTVTWSDSFSESVGSSPEIRSVSPSSNTTYTVTSVSDANCTGTSSGSAVITISSSPTVTATSDAPFYNGAYQIIAGQTLQLTASTVANATAYNWSRDGGSTFASGQTVSDVPPSGTHTYTVTVPTSCGTAVGSTPSIVVLSVDASGVPDNWKTEHGYSASAPSSTIGANGMTLLQSYLAGVNPNDPTSAFAIQNISVTPGGVVTIQWSSAQDGTTPTRNYDVHTTTNYFTGTGWSLLASNIAPQGSSTTYSDSTAANASLKFYRITIAGTNLVVTPSVAALQNLTLLEGRNYLSMSSLPVTNTLLGVLGTNQLPQGAFEALATVVEVWDQVNQNFGNVSAPNIYYLGTGTSGWKQDTTATPTNSALLDPNKGLIVTIRTGQGAQTLRLTGFVPTNNEIQTVAEQRLYGGEFHVPERRLAQRYQWRGRQRVGRRRIHWRRQPESFG